MKKIITIIMLLLILIITASTILYIFDIPIIIISTMKNISNNEYKVIIMRIVITLIILVMTISSCIISTKMARNKNRNVKNWRIICALINYWGILILYFLPKKFK